MSRFSPCLHSKKRISLFFVRKIRFGSVNFLLVIEVISHTDFFSFFPNKNSTFTVIFYHWWSKFGAHKTQEIILTQCHEKRERKWRKQWRLQLRTDKHFSEQFTQIIFFIFPLRHPWNERAKKVKARRSDIFSTGKNPFQNPRFRFRTSWRDPLPGLTGIKITRSDLHANMIPPFFRYSGKTPN